MASAQTTMAAAAPSRGTAPTAAVSDATPVRAQAWAPVLAPPPFFPSATSADNTSVVVVIANGSTDPCLPAHEHPAQLAELPAPPPPTVTATATFVATAANTTVFVDGAEVGEPGAPPRVWVRFPCFAHPVVKVIFNPYALCTVSTVLLGLGVWMSSMSSTGLTLPELGAVFFLGDATASLACAMFGIFKYWIEGISVKLYVSARDWRTYVTAIVFPILSIGGYVAFSLCIDYADGAVTVFAPLAGLTGFPPVVVGLIINRQCPKLFTCIGFVLCLAAVVVVSMDPDSGGANSTTAAADGLAENATTVITTTADVAAAATAFHLGGGTADSAAGVTDLYSDFGVAVAFFVVCFVLWSGSWCVSSFVASKIPLFDRCVMWFGTEAVLGAVFLAVAMAAPPSADTDAGAVGFSGWPFTAPAFAAIFGGRLLNKAGVVLYSEACVFGNTAILGPVANLYVLVASLLSIAVNGEAVTVYTGISLVLAVLGPTFLSLKQPSCNAVHSATTATATTAGPSGGDEDGAKSAAAADRSAGSRGGNPSAVTAPTRLSQVVPLGGKGRVKHEENR